MLQLGYTTGQAPNHFLSSLWEHFGGVAFWQNSARWRYFQIFGFFAILFYLVGKPRPLGFGHSYLFHESSVYDMIESPKSFESVDLASDVHKNMHQDVSTRIFFGKFVLWKHAFFKSELLRFVELIQGLRVRCFWRWCDLADPNSFPAKPQCLPTQKSNSSAFSCLFCQTWKLGCDSLQPTGCSDLHLPSHSYTATDRLIMILHVRYLLSLWCWPGSSQNQPRLLRSFSTIVGGSRIHRLKLKICNSWDCISIEIRIGFVLSVVLL